MSLQPSIDLLQEKILNGDILTPNEMKDIHNLLTTIRTSEKLISDDRIQSVAFGAAHVLAGIDTDTDNFRRHNAAVIVEAIRLALA